MNEKPRIAKRASLGRIAKPTDHDGIHPNYSISFDQTFDFESRWLTSNFKVVAASESDPIKHLDLAMGYSDDRTTYVAPLQMTADLDTAKSNTVFSGSLIDMNKDFSKPVEGACWGYVDTVSTSNGPGFYETFSYAPPSADRLKGHTQTEYIEVKNHSKKDMLSAVTLVYLDAADNGNSKSLVIANQIAPGKSIKFDLADSGLKSQVTGFHFEWDYEGNINSSDPKWPTPGRYFVWIKASISPDNSFFLQSTMET